MRSSAVSQVHSVTWAWEPGRVLYRATGEPSISTACQLALTPFYRAESSDGDLRPTPLSPHLLCFFSSPCATTTTSASSRSSSWRGGGTVAAGWCADGHGHGLPCSFWLVLSGGHLLENTKKQGVPLSTTPKLCQDAQAHKQPPTARGRSRDEPWALGAAAIAFIRVHTAVFL